MQGLGPPGVVAQILGGGHVQGAAAELGGGDGRGTLHELGGLLLQAHAGDQIRRALCEGVAGVLIDGDGGDGLHGAGGLAGVLEDEVGEVLGHLGAAGAVGMDVVGEIGGHVAGELMDVDDRALQLLGNFLQGGNHVVMDVRRLAAKIAAAEGGGAGGNIDLGLGVQIAVHAHQLAHGGLQVLLAGGGGGVAGVVGAEHDDDDVGLEVLALGELGEIPVGGPAGLAQRRAIMSEVADVIVVAEDLIQELGPVVCELGRAVVGGVMAVGDAVAHARDPDRLVRGKYADGRQQTQAHGQTQQQRQQLACSSFHMLPPFVLQASERSSAQTPIV